MSSHLLPDGIVLRPAGEGDAEAIAELTNAVEGPLGGDAETSADEMFANDDDRFNAGVYVHPDVQETGLARALLRMSEDDAPAWRKRGLGLAMLYEAFHRLRERGETVAGLGVDAQNPTGATRLYERTRMTLAWAATVYEKALA